MYRYENGRRYHAFRDGQYWGPNDSQNNNHEAIVHHLCILTLDDKLYLAPIENPKRILDVGTGTGIWAIDVADQNPQAEVLATDLSPIQATFMPPNLQFEIDDCCSTWVYPENHFDFIHLRGLFGSIADWPTLYEQCYKHLEPGGYIEQLEVSVTNYAADDDTPVPEVLKVWSDNADEVSKRSGKTWSIAETMPTLIREAGFVDVVEKTYKWPIGPWSSDPKLKELGRWNLLNWEEGMEGWIMACYTRVLGWKYQEVQDWLKVIRKALRDRRAHVYHEVYVLASSISQTFADDDRRVVYARKPTD
ncbi:hypothetical protein M8818_006474 [Zalaria obscura]|uniref:Uncharacterized protein n=1 Tax=Zalaria obscura TaxID=2024903 RepID=A0ACC3S6J1_9PEZI